uniref:Uncharacterized protein n=1 Tax=Chromera velia CCMP2878 TaxID=1169474 RepID=A0A0G4I3V0_9ALVE|eukprot:Cvel_35522.t1-p1 / transcript=Cvel_35522.t1 / gene=Cvel_35522 / organism=Chromera_velia_CCMP2878 / gene_product=hypothetical protein / transcript_product=hypothetical protein / location=Cvel_scaffold6526:755-2086(-) / protein_length=89 / sequence_SO=supercontig / SO=protein_coding / is_pseudo=false
MKDKQNRRVYTVRRGLVIDFSNNQCPIRREIEDLASLAVNTAFSDPDRFIDEYSIAIDTLKNNMETKERAGDALRRQLKNFFRLDSFLK